MFFLIKNKKMNFFLRRYKMPQKSICSFVNIINLFNLEYVKNKYQINSYVHKKKNFKIVKQIKRPRLITFSSNVDIELYNISESEFEFKEVKYLAVLKSNLQKAIRRNLVNSAITTAIKLLQIRGGTLLLLRRLCIIIVEDKLKNITGILEAYKILIWIMSSECGFVDWKNWILGLIREICSYEHMPIEHGNKINKWYNNEYSNYFVIRSYFGGMNGDMRLLQNVAELIANTTHIPEQIDIKVINKIKLIDKIYILKSAVDFHCMPNMLNNIQSKHNQFSLDEIKKTIWQNSSSLRYKFPNDIETEDIWIVIKDSVRKYQKFIIDTI